MATKHPGDSGNWNTDSGIGPRLSPQARASTDMGVTSPAVMEAMRAEDALLASVSNAWPAKRFTDRRPIPGRGRKRA